VPAGQDNQAAVSWSRCADELAVVIADVGPIGIDLEMTTARTPPERELALLLRHTRVRMRPPGCDAWCEWTAVEALVKANRCGLIGLITGRLQVIGRSGHSGRCTVPTPLRTAPAARFGQGPPDALFTVLTQHTTAGGDHESTRHQRWQVRHHHHGSHRLSVVLPD